MHLKNPLSIDSRQIVGVCACCRRLIADEIQYSVHRDGFGEGPEVPLCAPCGSPEGPTLEEIWDRIAKNRVPD